jgi:hypothetical protein
MLKPLNSIMAGAFIAAAITVLSIPTAKVNAQPSLKSADAVPACVERPWPYLNCVGAPFGNPRIRLVTTDHLTP